MPRPTSLKKLIEANKAKSVSQLSTEGQTLFELLVLIVDIKYRRVHGENLSDSLDRRYNDSKVFYE